MLHGSGKGACMGYTVVVRSHFPGECTCFVCVGGGGGGIITSRALVAFSVVDWLSDHLLVGRSQKENAADLRELLVTFLSKMTSYNFVTSCTHFPDLSASINLRSTPGSWA